MIQTNIILSIPLAQQIEAWLCEQDESRWCLLKERDEQGHYTLQGFYESEQEALAGFQTIKAEFPEIEAKPEFIQLEDKDWQDAYKTYLKPWHSGNLHWVPVWEKDHYNLPANHTALYFDAGMAFGTGAHETTRLCAVRLLDYLEEHPQDYTNKYVIDAGCGSGILAISAKLLGFNSVYGFDIDPEAVSVSKENLIFNDLPPESVQFETADLDKGLKNQQADVLLANILAPVLIENARLLLGSTHPDGILILSGILTTELDAVRQAFEAEAKTLNRPIQLDSRTDGEWGDVWVSKA